MPKNPYLNVWSWTVLAAPLWWALGLNLVIYHVMAFLLFGAMLYQFSREDRGLYVPPSVPLLFVLILILAFSLFLQRSSADPMRMLAAFYNLTFWGMGLFLILVMANVFSQEDIRPLLGVFFRLACLTGLLALGAFLIFKTRLHWVQFETPMHFLTRYLGKTTLVENSLTVKLIVQEWFGAGMHPRLNLYSPYAVATGTILMILLMMLITRARVEKKSASPVFWGTGALILGALLLTLSRMPILAFAVSLVAVFVVARRGSFFWVLGLLALVFFLYPWIERGLDFILGLRAGSNRERFELYRYSLQQLNGSDWFAGLGFKPRQAFAFGIPVGSHSTYVSLLYRGGMLGLGIFLCFKWNLLWRWFRMKDSVSNPPQSFAFWKGLGLVFIGMTLCMLTDEIDAPQFLAFLYFSLVGVFEGFRRRTLSS